MLIKSGQPLVTFTAIGSGSPESSLSPTRYDLNDDGAAHGLLVIGVKTTNGQGGTPTSPGASKKFTLHFAFSTDASIAAADAPTILQTKEQTLDCTLPDSNSATVAGQRHYEHDYVAITGRYLFVWGSTEAFASANAKINADVTANTI